MADFTGCPGRATDQQPFAHESGCQARAEVCARSKEELELANRLVVMAMNSGMSSTFLPFNCRN